MRQPPIPPPLKLDAWSASSLLQKSIRRGEVELAQHAAQILHRFRGKAIWKRLLGISIEDVGLGDLDLVWELTRLAKDKPLRDILGPDDELLRTICTKLALAPKDRSVDHVYCAATKLPAALDERGKLLAKDTKDLISTAAADLEPQTKRLSAAMLACTENRQCQTMKVGAVEQLLAALPRRCPTPLERTILTLAEQRAHPYSLVLPLLWSTFEWTGGTSGIAIEPVPEAEYVDGIPLYVFDKHTAAGKRAISRLPQRSAEVRHVLAQWVPEDQWVDVSLMAAFFADAAPVRKRLEWAFGRSLEFIGTHADMMSVGCSYEAVALVVECVRDNLHTVNELRRSALLSTGPRSIR